MTLPNLQYPPNLPSELAAVPIIDLRGRLSVNPRYTWEKLKGNRDLNALTHIVLHHDGLSKASTKQYTDEQLADRIARAHINSKKNKPTGDPGFPYDAWIRNGRLYIGNDMLPLKYGVKSNNTYTVHICVSGNYAEDDLLTDPDRHALYAAILLYKAQMPSYAAMVGHEDLWNTECPGYDTEKVKRNIYSIEQEMALALSPAKQEEIAWRMAAHILWLQRMAQNGIDSYGKPVTPEEKKRALRELLRIEKPFRELGWLK